MPLPEYRKKLTNLFSSIEDESLRIIIAEVVGLESENRSSPNFPIRKVETVIDNEASRLESVLTEKNK